MTHGFWRTLLARVWRDRIARLALLMLLALYTASIFAGFIAPVGPTTHHRDWGWHPPQLSRMHLFDDTGTFRGLFVYGTASVTPGVPEYEEDRTRIIPVRLLTRGAPYRLFGLSCDLHLFGTNDGPPPFLFGSDAYGRDLLSRVLYGGRPSLSIGLVGIAISLSLALFIGGVAGYLGGWVDFVLMRVVELVLAIPALYLVLTLRQAFATDLPSTWSYLLMVGALACVGWAGNARVVRGLVRTIKTREYVLAAEALGLSRWRVLWRHILPNTSSYVVVAATLSVPYYILGEVALSFLGVGIQAPDPSWGNLLHDAQSVLNLTDHAWVVIPGGFIFAAVLGFNFLGDALRDAVDPRA